EPNNPRASQHSWGGVCWIRELRHVSQRNHTRFPNSDARTTAGKRREREEYWLRVLPRAGQPARKKRRRGTYYYQSAQVAGDLFPMSLGSAGTVPIASSLSGAGRQDELRRLSQPACGDGC